MANLCTPITASATDILTTLPPLSGLIHWLDPKASVVCLLPNNADPHHFQLTPRQVESLRQTKLLVRSSRDDGQWPRLDTSATVLDLWPSQHKAHNNAHEAEHEGHSHEHGNHAWLNPQAVTLILPKLSHQLIVIYPEHQEAIQENLQHAQVELATIWQAWQRIATSQHLREKGSMMQHPAWESLFDALGIPIWIILESDKHGQERGPHILENGLHALQTHPQSLLIADMRHNNRSLEWLKRHHNSSTIITLDALGTTDETWPQLMQRNLEIIQHP